MTATAPSVPSSTRPLLVVFFTVFLDLLGFGLILPLQPLLAERLGASALEVGALMTTYSAMQLLFAPLWGRLSDRVGRRPVLLVSILGSVGSMVIFANATALPWLFAARTFAGIFNANLGTAQAYVADVTTPETRARGMGFMGMAFGLGFVLGPWLGGILSRGGWSTPAWVSAGLALANFVLALAFLPESLPKERRALAAASRRSRWQVFRHALRQPALPLLFLLFFLTTLGFAQLEATFSLFTERRFGYSVHQNGWLFGFIGLVLAVVQGGVVHPLQRRIGERWVVVAGTALLGGGLLLMPGADRLPGLLVALLVISVGSGLQGPALSSLVSKQAPPDELGGVLGVNQSMASLGRILGPLAGGAAFDASGPSAPFLVAAGILGLALLLALRIASAVRS